MRAATRAAICALLITDPSITAERRNMIELALDGRDGGGESAPELNDRVLKRSEVAKMLNVTCRTVTHYAKRGLIRPLRFGADGARAVGYSERSVRALMMEVA